MPLKGTDERMCGWPLATADGMMGGSSSVSRARTRCSISSRTGRTALTSRPAGSGEDPFFVVFAGDDGAGVAAAHGDDDVGGLDDLVGPGLGVLAGDVDVAFGHGLDRGGVDFVARFGAAGPGDRGVAGVVLEEAHRHLGAAGVVGAQEQHGGFAVMGQPFDLGQGVQALPGEAFGQQRQEVGDGGVGGELLVEGVQEPFDRLGPTVPSKSRVNRVAAVSRATRWSRVICGRG